MEIKNNENRIKEVEISYLRLDALEARLKACENVSAVLRDE